MGSGRARGTRRPGTRRRLSRRALAALAAAVSLALSACARDLPQSALEPAGPRAERADDLWNLVFWIAVVIFVLVEGALVYALIRFRARRRDETPVQLHGNTRLEIAWTLVPALILAGVAVPTIGTIFSLSARPAAEERPVEIEVVGHQWWWEFRYTDEGFVTANEMHIPVDRPVYLTLRSAETPGGLAGFTDRGEPVPQDAIPVIHSFWVPRLSGKQDMVPGRTHFLTLEASEPGTYPGQCAEYCGISHANMRLTVVAHSEQEYEAWVEQQRAAPAEPREGSLAAEGAEIFQQFQGATAAGSCLACHTLDPAQGDAVGPNLAHFGSRRTLGAGIVPLNERNLRAWLEDPRSVKPGVVMPDYTLTEEQIEALVAYLQSLE